MKKMSPYTGNIAAAIHMIRGERVLLDRDLARMYGVKVKVLVQAVKRNRERFPDDFMFQLDWQEVQNSRSQFVTLKHGQNIKYLPYAFTEQGVAMLSGILRSKTAIRVNIAIMRAFVRLREILSSNKELAHKLRELENKAGKHDEEIQAIFAAIRRLMSPPPEKPSRKIGFQV